MNVIKKPKLTTRLKEHWNTHKFTYGYFTGVAVTAIASYAITDALEKADDSKWDAAQDEAETMYPDQDALALRARDGRFAAVPQTKIN